MGANYQQILAEIYAETQSLKGQGQVASYIPALGLVNPNQYGIAIQTLDGHAFQVGDANIPFSIQSISKVFILSMVFGTLGEELWSRVGREPSGNAFNSLMQLETENGIPRNPFINAGALVATDCLVSQANDPHSEILQFARSVSNHPWDGERILTSSQAKRVDALMQVCGLYDDSGEFAFTVGLPGKSGVGGGIVAVIPNLLSICVWSPELNPHGTSQIGMKALELFTTKTGISIF